MTASGTSSGTRFVPAEFSTEWAVPPGRLIMRELEAGGFSQADVASRTNLSAKHLNQVLKGHVPLSPEVALSLERVLDGDAELWLRIEARWQASRAREASHESLATLVNWVREFPTHTLRKRGAIDTTASPTEQVEELLRFFRVADTTAFDRVWLAPQANYKRSQKFDIDPYATALWIRLAEVEAEKLTTDANRYESISLRSAAQALPALTREPIAKGFRHAQERLLEAGVLLVFTPEISGTRICGLSRSLTNGHPMIALTGRYKFHDIFWFTMLHEIGHILLHPKRATYLDVEKKRGAHDDADEQETAANNFAQDLLLSESDRERLLGLQTPEDLQTFCKHLDLSPGMIAGQFAHATNDWRRFARFRDSSDINTALTN